jgi:co-chaperonin GroES (HSP10)
MKISPMHNYVHVKLHKKEDTERNSGLLAVGDNDKRVLGTIVALGPEVRESLVVGQEVLVPPYGAGITIDVDDRLYLDNEILGSFQG